MTPKQTAPTHSPDQSVNTTGPVAQAIVRGETVRGWVTNVLLALSIITMGVLWVLYFEVRRANWLDQYEINAERSEDIAPLKAQATSQQSEISALQVRLAVRDECKR